MQTHWHLLSDGHFPQFFAGHGKLLTGLVKTFYTDHSLMRSEERGLPYFPELLRSEFTRITDDPNENLLREKVLKAKYLSYADYPPNAPERSQCKTFAQVVLEKCYYEDAFLKATREYERQEKLVSSPSKLLSALSAFHSPPRPSLQTTIKRYKKWAYEEWVQKCLFGWFNFENMPIEKYSTCKWEWKKKGDKHFRAPLRDEGGKVVPSKDPNDMVHKITFLNYYLEGKGQAAKKIWYTMGVDVIPTKSGHADLNSKLKHVKNNIKLLVAESDGFTDDPYYSIKLGGKKIPIHVEYDRDAYWKAFDKERDKIITYYKEIFGADMCKTEEVNNIIFDELETWKHLNRGEFAEKQVHTWGYQILSVINESYDEIKGQPFSTWPKKSTDKHDPFKKCNNNNGYPSDVANILKYHNPQNLPLD